MKRIRRCAHAERTTIRAFVAVVLVAPCSLAQSDRLPRHAVLGASAVDRDGVRVSALRPGGCCGTERLARRGRDCVHRRYTGAYFN